MAHIAAGGTELKSFAETLWHRTNVLFKHAAGGDSNLESKAQQWLRSIHSEIDRFDLIQDAGICGEGPPRAAHLRILLEVLNVRLADRGTAVLGAIAALRKAFPDDPALDGNLLELEEILKFKRGDQIQVSSGKRVRALSFLLTKG